MGNKVSVEEKKAKSILHQLVEGEVSPLYWACRAGDINRVRELLASLKYSDINRLEPNGSTALHAASLFGHADVVRLLVQERGVMRHRRNRHGLTAFQEAVNDEIRQLFIRPSGASNRFCNNDTKNEQQLLTVIRGSDQNANDDNNDNDDDDDGAPPRGWVDAVADEKSIEGMQITIAVGKSLFGSRFTRSFTFAALNRLSNEPFSSYENEESVRDFLQHLVDEHVTPRHPQYDKACQLLAKFAQTKRIEPLLRLYTLDTPFYCQLPYESDAWLLPLICHFVHLKPRFFQGTSYRGLSMTNRQLKSYRWARKNALPIIKTNTFCSTSVDRDVAEGFSTPSSDGDKISVLMIFEFPHLCDTAIQLYAISDKLPCLSDFENEREVLLLPNTLFYVKRIDNIGDQQYTTIWLEHVPPEQHPIRALLHCMAKDIRKE